MACYSRIPRATSTGIHLFYLGVSWIRKTL